MDNKISPVKRAALVALDSIKRLILNDCSDAEVAKALVRFHPCSDVDYFNPNDYLNYDEACNFLNLGKNRCKLNRLCKKHGIKSVSVKNRPLGFRRSDMERLKREL